ncbi:MAG: hypothetical protein E2O96_01770, partial [Acidobacteria bacterium]
MRLLSKNSVGRRYRRLHPAVQRKLKVAVPYFSLGLIALVVTYLVSEPPDWRFWLVFAALFVLLELFTVEVNDRLMQSSSIMVVMTAGVIFALRADSDALFAMTLMAAIGAFAPDDFR